MEGGVGKDEKTQERRKGRIEKVEEKEGGGRKDRGEK